MGLIPEERMKLQGEGKLLRIFIGESDKADHHALFSMIVKSAKERGLAGATVLRGVEGFGANSRSIHTARILRLSEDLPILIEIVDTEDKIQAFLPVVDGLLERSGCGAMVTLEKVQVLHYGPSETSRGM
jgi:PII-like signaling protein